MEVLTKVEILPALADQVPCTARFLGDLAEGQGSHGLAGRVYFLNRLTFAILGFSYNGGASGRL